MNEQGGRPPITIVASPAELAGRSRIWGTGGWQPPEEREARDWLVLARVLGWKAAVETELNQALQVAGRVTVIARDWHGGSEERDLLHESLASSSVTLITRTPLDAMESQNAIPESAAISGRTLTWLGPGPRRVWSCAKPLAARRLEADGSIQVWATLGGKPVITARPASRGMLVTLGFHPSEACDAAPAASQLLKHLLIWGPAGPAAWYELGGTLVLRMDDPGGSQNVFSRTWCYPKLGEDAWCEMASVLRRHDARISLGYVPGWVDDGDAGRGRLQVGGKDVPRRAGRIWPSPRVSYLDVTGHRPGTLHDYESEYRGIQQLRREGCGEVELHGFTHLHPDRSAWAAAADRYESIRWFRELGRDAARTIEALPHREHPVVRGAEALQTLFGVTPTTLICPGDEWTDSALETALELNFTLVSSYYLAIRCEERFCWAQQIQAPYLNEAARNWFDSAFPVVGYFHDYEPAVYGVGWFRDYLDLWVSAGAGRVMDFKELSAYLSRTVGLEDDVELRLRVTAEALITPPRPIRVFMHYGQRTAPAPLTAVVNGRQLDLHPAPGESGAAYVDIPS